jgi:hypothetical protein
LSSLGREMPPFVRQESFRRPLLHGLVAAGLIFAVYLFLVAAQVKGSMAFDVVSYQGG